MNVVILKGNLSSDVTVRYSQGENPMAIARFSVAVRKEKKVADGQPNADFINCIAFGKVAENIEKYFHKGSAILVKGSWQTGNYKNQSGVTIYTNDCLVQTFEFCESRNASSNDTPSNNASSDLPTPDTATWLTIPEGIEDDLPFK